MEGRRVVGRSGPVTGDARVVPVMSGGGVPDGEQAGVGTHGLEQNKAERNHLGGRSASTGTA